MISIQPQWVEKILNGEKTIEIRKTMPKCELPCKVYIYCTQGQMLHDMKSEEYWDGKRFAYGSNKSNNVIWSSTPFVNGKVVAEFTLNKITTHLHNFIDCEDEEGYNFLVEDVKKAGFNTEIDGLLDFDKFVEEYGEGKPLYAWHIDNLKIYDKPKELSEFSGFIPNNKCEKHKKGFNCNKCDAYDKEHDTCLALYYCHKPIKRPPQSWCYVEDMESKQ